MLPGGIHLLCWPVRPQVFLLGMSLDKEALDLQQGPFLLPLVFFFFFKKFCVCIRGVHRVQKRVLDSPGAGVTGGCELTNLAAGTQTWVL